MAKKGVLRGDYVGKAFQIRKKSSCCYHLQPQNGLNLNLEIYKTDHHLEKGPPNPPCHLDPSKNAILEGGQWCCIFLDLILHSHLIEFMTQGQFILQQLFKCFFLLLWLFEKLLTCYSNAITIRGKKLESISTTRRFSKDCDEISKMAHTIHLCVEEKTHLL